MFALVVPSLGLLAVVALLAGLIWLAHRSHS